jgi:hypothetical protein
MGGDLYLGSRILLAMEGQTPVPRWGLPDGHVAAPSKEAEVLVEVALPASSAMFSRLGSLTERFGMYMYPNGPLHGMDEVRVSIGVPRAHTLRQAEEVVAGLLERARQFG